MEKIIDPVEPSLLVAELTPDKKLGDTNKGGNELYVVTAFDSPNVFREIGRLREVCFRKEGGSSGLAMDIDEYDTMEKPYSQLVVWNPESNAIIGGYRFIFGPDVVLKENGQPKITSSHLFRYSDRFISDYLPYSMELGRSFVTPEYQSSKAGAKAIFAMDNLWDGIGSLMMLHPQIKYCLGKMTIYPSYDKDAFNLIQHYLWKHFEDTDELVRPYDMLPRDGDERLMDLILKEEDSKADYRCLKEAVMKLGTFIPPLVNSYIQTSPSLKMFGCCINDELGNVYETGIMVSIQDMYPEKRDRHIKPFFVNRVMQLRERFPQLKEGIEERLAERWKQRKFKSKDI